MKAEQIVATPVESCFIGKNFTRAILLEEELMRSFSTKELSDLNALCVTSGKAGIILPIPSKCWTKSGELRLKFIYPSEIKP